MARGRKTGGKVKGSKNKCISVREICGRLGVDPFEYMAQMVRGDLPCNVCRGVLKTKYLVAKTKRNAYRECQSCKETGFEKLSPDSRLRAAESLAAYLAPKLTSTAITGANGESPSWIVVTKTNENK